MKKLILVLLTIGMVACIPEGKPAPTKMTESQKAKAAADSIRFTENAEIDNIKKRLELTSDPGLTGYIVLLNEMGRPVMYTGIKGKITSGGKRLTNPQRMVKCDTGEWTGDCIVDAPSDEGTWGHSNPYIYFWTFDGKYMQWNGKYLYSDKPFRLTDKPLVVSVEQK